MNARPEPTLIFALAYTDDRKNGRGEVWPVVAWMWAAPRVGDMMEVEVAYGHDGTLRHRVATCKVVAAVLFSYGSEGLREYAGSLTLEDA